ncbi:hypothetical protein BpHYR1_040307 [Brachionus plicatilis]|uniref:Uncharacterized protein n=1 Tax=Brachionus plicatilis TaxID=10195 RepID=A0A3M7PKH6_BRAPC|nr:hypothetical protein BpHYR1_040307 [Brachionus plicatilis]
MESAKNRILRFFTNFAVLLIPKQFYYQNNQNKTSLFHKKNVKTTSGTIDLFKKLTQIGTKYCFDLIAIFPLKS